MLYVLALFSHQFWVLLLGTKRSLLPELQKGVQELRQVDHAKSYGEAAANL